MKWILTLLTVGAVHGSGAEEKVYVSPFGAISGGGGKVVVCPSEVKLLDLWEGETLFGKTPLKSPATVEQMIEANVDRLMNSYAFNGGGGFGDGNTYQNQEFVRQFLLHEARRFLRPDPDVLHLRGVSLTLTDDSYEAARPKGCEIAQAINYQPNGRVLVDADLFDQLDAINRAALITHEAYYEFLRDFARETNSIRVRRAIGHVFAGNVFRLPLDSISPTALYCASEDGWKNVVTLSNLGSTIPDLVRVGVRLSRVEGSQLIGVEQDHSEFMFREDVFNSFIRNDCMGTGTELSLYFNGPVEFDRAMNFGARCNGSGNFKFYMLSRKPGTNEEKEIPLLCHATSVPRSGSGF